MNFNLKVLAAALSELEGKRVSVDNAWHIVKNVHYGRNAERLLRAFVAYSAVILEQYKEAGEIEAERKRLNDIKVALKQIIAELPALYLKKTATEKADRKSKNQPKIALIGGEKVGFDLVTRRSLSVRANEYKYLGAGEVLEISGWQSRKFRVGDKALFWKSKSKN